MCNSDAPAITMRSPPPIILSEAAQHRSVSGVGRLNVKWRRGEREVIELPKLKLRHRGQV
ncbi:hypothetical protein AX14_004143 [Amanita brunnescens Koide BX004]|nr:hypothetical protein AX14_004143 [Amanita brunnescens Koide BX004]